MASIKERISMLLNLAGNNPSENEAKAALLKARELMVKHKLDLEDCQMTKEPEVIREELGFTCTSMTNAWAASLSAVIAEHYCCCAYRSHMPGKRTNKIGLVGLEDDFAIAKQAVMYAFDCVTSACKRQIKKNPRDPAGTYREKCNAYGWGFTMGVRDAFNEQSTEHQEWGLVLSIPQAVTDSMKDMGKRSCFGKDRSEHNDCRQMGYEDGRKFDPSTRPSTAPEPAAIGDGC